MPLNLSTFRGEFTCVCSRKLGNKHNSNYRDFITDFLCTYNPEGAAARNPVTKKVHPHGLSSAGPNEEWGLDGHEKLLLSMRVGVYGGTDKYSRLKLGLWACPNPRDPNLPIAMWLRMVKEVGGEYRLKVSCLVRALLTLR